MLKMGQAVLEQRSLILDLLAVSMFDHAWLPRHLVTVAKKLCQCKYCFREESNHTIQNSPCARVPWLKVLENVREY
jgi:hypothetical protein